MPIISNFPSGGAKKALLQSKEITPTKENQTVVPDEGYDGLSDVEVSAIPDEYADVSGVTATASNVLAGDKFVGSDGVLRNGTMPDNEDVDVTLDTENTEYVIPEGKHSGDGVVSILLQEKSATPSTSEQIITPDSGKVLSKVTIAAIDPNLINTTISSNAAAADDIVSPKQAWVNGELVTGTMVDNGTVTKTLDVSTTSYTIPAGKHSGSSKVSITTQTKTATPSTSSQTITADSGKVLSSVSVGAIPSTYVRPISTQAAKTWAPGTTNQNIPAGTYLTGQQTIQGDADLVASNIKSGVSIFGVTGSYSPTPYAPVVNKATDTPSVTSQVGFQFPKPSTNSVFIGCYVVSNKTTVKETKIASILYWVNGYIDDLGITCHLIDRYFGSTSSLTGGGIPNNNYIVAAYHETSSSVNLTITSKDDRELFDNEYLAIPFFVDVK